MSDNDGASTPDDEFSDANGAGASGQRKPQDTNGNDPVSDDKNSVSDNDGVNTSNEEFSESDGAGASG